MAINNITAKKRNLFIPIILLVLFIGPMVAAWLLYASKTFQPTTTNNGHLISPPLQLTSLALSKPQALKGKWLFVYINPNACTVQCEKNIYFMRQIRTSLGKDMDRVVRVYITYPAENNTQLQNYLARGYDGTEVFTTNPQVLQQFLSPLAYKQQILTQGSFFLVDPLGNVMMNYSLTQKPKEILKDLKRLLAVSQIG